MVKTSKHDSLVNIIELELKYRGFNPTQINKFKEYHSRIQDGEIDLYTSKYNNILIFEIKSNDTYKGRKKAIEQLDRAEKNYFSTFNNKNVRYFKFYAYWNKDNTYKIEWIKNLYSREPQSLNRSKTN